MRRQINVMLEEAELGEIEQATPGVRGGPAVRCAALSFARGMTLVRVERDVSCADVPDALPSEGGEA